MQRSITTNTLFYGDNLAIMREYIPGANVVLAVDTSGSMAASDVAPDRLSAAQEAAETFRDRSPKDLRGTRGVLRDDCEDPPAHR